MIDTKKDLELVTDKGIPLMIADPVIKTIFKDSPNALAKLISDIADINYYELEDNINILNNELSISTKKEKYKKTDFLVKIDNNKYINLEMNNHSEKSDLIKNLSYVFHIYSKTTKKSNKYDNNMEISQINLDYHSFNMDKPLEKFYLMNEDNNILTKSIILYFLNIEKCYDIWYNSPNKNKLSNYIKWGAFIASGKYEEMEELLNDLVTESECRKIMSTLENIKVEDLFWSDEEQKEWDIWLENSHKESREKARAEGRAEGHAMGQVEGIEQEKINIIKSMLENSIEYELISKVTNKSISEIKEIEKSMNE
mgnify:CR=1 FL=1